MPAISESPGVERELRELIREIPDFPRPGIAFKDITPLLLNPAALRSAIAGLRSECEPLRVEIVVAAEARGFMLGGALAAELGAGFAPARKPGKLPYPTIAARYELEYGIDALELHADAFADGARVLVHDDLLATGGTARALCDLVDRLGGQIVGCSFLVELTALGGRERLAPHPVRSLIAYES